MNLAQSVEHSLAWLEIMSSDRTYELCFKLIGLLFHRAWDLNYRNIHVNLTGALLVPN